MTIAATTAARMWLDGGTFTIDGVDVGASPQQTGTFAVEQEIYKPRLAGARGFIAGIAKIITEHATLQMNLVELNIGNLQKVLPMVTSTSDANSEYTVSESFGYIGASEHLTVLWDGETMDNDDVLIKLYNALPDGGLSATLSDTAESQIAITYRSHYTMAAPKTRNWQVFVAK